MSRRESAPVDGAVMLYRAEDMDAHRNRSEAIAEQEKKPQHPYDLPSCRGRFSKVRNWHEQELMRQAANRYQMALDCDYYDGLQWTEEEMQVLFDRGQAPLVFNEIKSTIDWMIGTERRTRIDYKILPRQKEDSEGAEVKTDLLKYLEDTNKAPFERSRAFADTCKAGLGWLEIGIRADPTEEPLYFSAESWKNMLYDSQSVKPDLSDARYLFRWKWLDTDIGEAYFPERAHIVRQAAHAGLDLVSEEDEIWYMGQRVTADGQDYASRVGRYAQFNGNALAHSARERVKMIECWYKSPKMKHMICGGDCDGEEYDRTNEGHVQALKAGYSVYDKLDMEMRVMIFTSAGVLFDGPSPFRHGKFPFVPIWCYRRQRDNAPYGPIRQLRDPQDDINKRKSKSQWILSTNQVEMEDGAVDDLDELREEVARPDGVIVRKRGKELKVVRDAGIAREHMDSVGQSIQHIHGTGGVTPENLGQQTNANSGKAIGARQEQGGVVTTEIFDNLAYAQQLAGEIELALTEQFYTAPKVVRIVGERGAAKFSKINELNPDTGEVLNDITASQADYVVSKQAFRDSLRQAMFESLFDIIGRLAQVDPRVALNLLDLVVDMADSLPGKDVLVARIRQINGQRDPDAEITPEEQKAIDDQKQAEAEQQELAIETVRAQLKELQAKGDKIDADAILQRVSALEAALRAAQAIVVAPATAVVADTIVQGAGMADPGAMVEQLPTDLPPPAPSFDLPPGSTGALSDSQLPGNDGMMQP